MIFRLISRWFEPVSVPQEYRRGDYLILWLLMAIGVVLRFWGLDSVGLHGDEETMAMPAMAILETGQPMLPSGMYYARSLLNIYMMSGSVWFFGESEWAFRLPSAIVGSLTGVAAFFMGRRFLAPQFNLAFVATIVFLPTMIEISQTARMYVFFVTCIIWFAACLFRWERDQRIISLVLAMLVWLLALHFHQLSVFAAPLFLFPGLSRKSWSQLIQGAVAFVTGALIFFIYDHWISTKYPSRAERPPVNETDTTQSAIEVLLSANAWVLAISVVIALLIMALMIKNVSARGRLVQLVPVLLVSAGLLSIAMLHYHVGIIFLILGAIFWLRSENLARTWLIPVLGFAVFLTIVHLGFLYETGQYPGRKIIGALVGMPSVWPILRFLQYSPVAGIIYVLILIVALRNFARGDRLPIDYLFFAMSVWAPLLLIGFAAWNIPPRYAQGLLAFFLMCTFSGMAYIASDKARFPSTLQRPTSANSILVLITLAIVNPIAFARAVNPSYEHYPDHKGAAEYIESLELPDSAIIVAEDVLQQTYYLGQVDYSLRPITDARIFSIMQDGVVVDQYTGAPVLGSGSELESLINSTVARELYIIGSGENFVGGKRMLRSQGIDDALQSEQLEVVYTGRDGKTKIWRKRH
jgi:4-amino-4-deoxy-L-arabinose transferase-like glycosyltransferase